MRGERMRNLSLSVVIPVFNSGDMLETLLLRLQPVLAAQAANFEIILVNDGSRDRSWEVICRLTARYPHLRGINLMRNYGQHNALLCGIRAARYDAIVTMDDDLQHPPEEIPKLLRKLAEGHDLVYGTAEREPHGFWRGQSSRLTKWVLGRILGAEAGRSISAFRAFRTSLRQAFSDYRGPLVQIDVLLSWGTSRFASIAVPHQPRRIGVSNYTFQSLVVHAIKLFTGSSTLPLRLATWVGFGSIAFGMLVLAWVFGNYLIHGAVQPGFPFLASIIAIFAGAQLFALGILGEYMAQVHCRLMEKPAYIIYQESDSGDVPQLEVGDAA
jgi:glycosyltransferase involved in cell wall biosynthesis